MAHLLPPIPLDQIQLDRRGDTAVTVRQAALVWTDTVEYIRGGVPTFETQQHAVNVNEIRKLALINDTGKGGVLVVVTKDGAMYNTEVRFPNLNALLVSIGWQSFNLHQLADLYAAAAPTAQPERP